MNRSELSELKTGDVVVFDPSYCAFSKGKEYEVVETDVGSKVVDDNGRGIFLWDRDLYDQFIKEERK